MTFEEMQEFLNKVQTEKTQTKIMNALLSCYQQVKQHEKMIIELQEKTNEMIIQWNKEFGVPEDNIEDAETVNPDISEDMIEEDDLPEATVAANQEVQEVK